MAVEGLVATGPPVLPKWLFFLRIAIIVLSFGVLIAGAVNVASFNSWGWSASSGPGGFLIFDAIFTWIILGTMLAFELWYHQFYLRLTYVVLLPLAAIFWLSAWAWAASVASAFRGSYDDIFFGEDDGVDRYSSSIAACAALGAFTWVAIIVLTIFYVVACLRDNNDTVHQTEMGMPSKTEAAPVPAAVPANGFNQNTQDYYGGQAGVQPQQTPYSQEMPSPQQYQQPQQGVPYPSEHSQRQ